MSIVEIEKSSKDFKQNHTIQVHGNDDSIIPAWFQKWSDEVYENRQPAWFKKWNEEVYQKQPPQWFEIFRKNEFEPLVALVKQDHELLMNVIKLNNLRTK